MKASLIRAGTRVLRYLPEAVAMPMALALADLSWMVMGGRRRILEHNLRYTAADRTPAERRRLGRETFRNLARCTIDFLRIPLLTPSQIIAMFEIEGREHLDRAVARDKGVIVTSAHLGNFELSAALLGAHGYRCHVVAEDTDVNAATYELYERYRGATGTRVIPLSRAAGSALYALKRGDVVALVSDRLLTGDGPVVDFCGGRRQMPLGAAALARRSGATILIAYCTLEASGVPRYRCVITPLSLREAEPTDDNVTQVLADSLSAVIRQHPDQWFVFQPAWLEPNESVATASVPLGAR